MLLRRRLAADPTRTALASLPEVPTWERGPQRLTLAAHADMVTSYGQLSCGVALYLLARGVDVAFVPRVPPWQPWGVTLPEELRGRLVQADPETEWALQLDPPFGRCAKPGKTVACTMWETDGILPAWVDELNRCAAVCVPCAWNEQALRAAGVAVPIRYAPLGCLESYTYQEPQQDGDFVVGVLGRYAHGGVRKGTLAAMETWRRAFPDAADVRLWYHAHPDDPGPPFADPRVLVTRGAWGPERLRRWYAGLDVFLTLARGEGFGMPALEAMACGRPVIGAAAGGHAEFLDSGVGYPLPWSYEQAETTPEAGMYRGRWFRPDEEAAVRILRQAYADRPECEGRGRSAAARARLFPRARFHAALWSALVSAGAVVEPPTPQDACAALGIPWRGDELLELETHMEAIWRPDAEVLYSLVRHAQPHLVAEYGTNRGTSTTVIALALLANGRGRVVTVDREWYSRDLIPAACLPLIDFRIEDGHAATLPEADLVFEDGPHTYGFTHSVCSRYARMPGRRWIVVHDTDFAPEVSRAMRDALQGRATLCGDWIFESDPPRPGHSRGRRNPGLAVWEVPGR